MEPGALELDARTVRRRFGGHLSGRGIEIGPGHVPFPVPETVEVRYVDRWEPQQNQALFPELGESPAFPQPDHVVNLDVDRLVMFADASQDFVIASHLIEHLANPLAMLVELHRVLKPGGLLILLVPDRHKTFDRHRRPTPLEHVVDEYRRDVHEVDDTHILDYLIGTREPLGDTRDISVFTAERMAGEIELHRRRSVHAHVWDAAEFSAVLRFAATDLGVSFQTVDTMAPGDEGTFGDEFGWVFARAQPSPSGPARRWRRRRVVPPA